MLQNKYSPSRGLQFLWAFFLLSILSNCQRAIDHPLSEIDLADSIELIDIEVEHAITPESQTIGLMGRRSIPQDWGLFFWFKEKSYKSFWMFHCLVDLTISFIDENFIVQEVYLGRSYPNRIDPKRPVHKMEDFNLYNSDEELVNFFRAREIRSKFPASYVLETDSTWVKSQRIAFGDRIIIRQTSNRATILKPVSLDLQKFSQRTVKIINTSTQVFPTLELQNIYQKQILEYNSLGSLIKSHNLHSFSYTFSPQLDTRSIQIQS